MYYDIILHLLPENLSTVYCFTATSFVLHCNTLYVMMVSFIHCTLHCTALEKRYRDLRQDDIILYLMPENLSYGLLFHSDFFRAALLCPVCHDGYFVECTLIHCKKFIGTPIVDKVVK